MFVFISWSGDKSKRVAQSLESWLKKVIQAVEPWISVDIGKGSRWNPELSAKLEQSKFEIACLTKDNLNAPYVLYEAGALTKTKDANLCTFLLDIKHVDVDYPLAQFQHTLAFDKEDVFRLVKTINEVVKNSNERALDDASLKDVFDMYWPRLELELKEANALPGTAKKADRTPDDMLQEALELLRLQDRRLALLEQIVPGYGIVNTTPFIRVGDTLTVSEVARADTPLPLKDDARRKRRSDTQQTGHDPSFGI